MRRQQPFGLLPVKSSRRLLQPCWNRLKNYPTNRTIGQDYPFLPLSLSEKDKAAARGRLTPKPCVWSSITANYTKILPWKTTRPRSFWCDRNSAHKSHGITRIWRAFPKTLNAALEKMRPIRLSPITKPKKRYPADALHALIRWNSNSAPSWQPPTIWWTCGKAGLMNVWEKLGTTPERNTDQPERFHRWKAANLCVALNY